MPEINVQPARIHPMNRMSTWGWFMVAGLVVAVWTFSGSRTVTAQPTAPMPVKAQHNDTPEPQTAPQTINNTGAGRNHGIGGAVDIRGNNNTVVNGDNKPTTNNITINTTTIVETRIVERVVVVKERPTAEPMPVLKPNPCEAERQAHLRRVAEWKVKLGIK